MSGFVRDCVFQYWSPSKDIRWLTVYYRSQAMRIVQYWSDMTFFVRYSNEQPQALQHAVEDLVISANVERGWIRAKILSADSTFFRKFLLMNELLHRNNTTDETKQIFVYTVLLNGGPNQILMNLNCSCCQNMETDVCSDCDYRRELLKKFGGGREKHDVILRCHIPERFRRIPRQTER